MFLPLPGPAVDSACCHSGPASVAVSQGGRGRHCPERRCPAGRRAAPSRRCRRWDYLQPSSPVYRSGRPRGERERTCRRWPPADEQAAQTAQTAPADGLGNACNARDPPAKLPGRCRWGRHYYRYTTATSDGRVVWHTADCSSNSPPVRSSRSAAPYRILPCSCSVLCRVRAGDGGRLPAAGLAALTPAADSQPAPSVQLFIFSAGARAPAVCFAGGGPQMTRRRDVSTAGVRPSAATGTFCFLCGRLQWDRGRQDRGGGAISGLAVPSVSGSDAARSEPPRPSAPSVTTHRLSCSTQRTGGLSTLPLKDHHIRRGLFSP